MNNIFFTIDKGVPMGSKWSPIIYNFFISIIMKEFINKNKNKMKLMKLSLYADDLILNINEKFIEEIIKEYALLCKKNKIKINYTRDEFRI